MSPWAMLPSSRHQDEIWWRWLQGGSHTSCSSAKLGEEAGSLKCCMATAVGGLGWAWGPGQGQ